MGSGIQERGSEKLESRPAAGQGDQAADALTGGLEHRSSSRGARVRAWERGRLARFGQARPRAGGRAGRAPRRWPRQYLTDVLAVLFDPGLRTHLYRVPGTTQGRRVAKIERIQVVNTHLMKQGRGKDVDPLGHFPMPMPDHLCPQ